MFFFVLLTLLPTSAQAYCDRGQVTVTVAPDAAVQSLSLTMEGEKASFHSLVVSELVPGAEQTVCLPEDIQPHDFLTLTFKDQGKEAFYKVSGVVYGPKTRRVEVPYLLLQQVAYPEGTRYSSVNQQELWRVGLTIVIEDNTVTPAPMAEVILHLDNQASSGDPPPISGRLLVDGQEVAAIIGWVLSGYIRCQVPAPYGQEVEVAFAAADAQCLDPWVSSGSRVLLPLYLRDGQQHARSMGRCYSSYGGYPGSWPGDEAYGAEDSRPGVPQITTSAGVSCQW